MENKVLELKPAFFLLMLFVYCITSAWFYIDTSTGWARLLQIIPCAIFFILFWSVSVITIILKKIEMVRIPTAQVWILLGVQIFTLLFNYGDCGDANGGRSFFEALIPGREWSCKPLLGERPAALIWVIGTITYIVLLIRAIIKIVCISKKKGL